MFLQTGANIVGEKPTLEVQCGMSWAAHSFRYNRKEPVRSDTCAAPRRCLRRADDECLCAGQVMHCMPAWPVLTMRPNLMRIKAMAVRWNCSTCRAHPGLQQRSCQEVGASRHQLPLEVPAEHSAVARVAGPRHDVRARLRLPPNHVRDVLRLRAPQSDVSRSSLGRSERIHERALTGRCPL